MVPEGMKEALQQIKEDDDKVRPLHGALGMSSALGKAVWDQERCRAVQHTPRGRGSRRPLLYYESRASRVRHLKVWGARAIVLLPHRVEAGA